MAYNSKTKSKRRHITEEDDYVYPTKRMRHKTRDRRQSANIIQAGLIAYECPEDEDGTPMSDMHDMDQEVLDDRNEMINEVNANEDLAQKIEDKRDIEYHEAMSDLYDPWNDMGYDD